MERAVGYPKRYEAALFLLVVVVPLLFLPSASSPFADLKLPGLALAALVLWFSRPPLDRRLSVLGAIWFAVAVAAAIAGVDPLRSMTGRENAPGGLLLIGVAAYLLAIGAAMPERYVERIPRWLVSASVLVAGVAIAWRLVPGAFETVLPGLAFTGSTLGNGPFLASYLALGLVALPHVSLPRWQQLAAALILGAALGGTPHRAALIVTAIGFCFTIWHAMVSRRTVMLIASATLVAFFTWGFVISALVPAPASTDTRPALVASFVGRQANSVRLASIAANVRSGLDRPLLGWGPGNGLSAWTTGVLPSDFPAIEQFVDAHNIVVEEFATTGLLGLAAFAALMGTTGWRIVRRPRPTGWIAAGAMMLVLVHLLEPLNVVTTSLGFLILGLAARPKPIPGQASDAERVEQRRSGRKVGRVAVGGLLGVAVVLSSLTLVSSVLEQHEREYFEESHGQLRLATRLTPWRITSQADLATQLAVDARGGNEQAKAEAFAISERLMAEHPWDPSVYITAIGVHVLALDQDAVQPIIDEHVERFPSVPTPVLRDVPGLGATELEDATGLQDATPPPG